MLILLIAIVILIIWWPTPASAAAGAERTAAANATPRQQSEQDIEQSTLVRGGDMAPDFTVEMLDGSSITLSSLRGKVVLLNFWATWCPPCREELARVQKEIIDRFEGEPFVFLPVSRGEKRITVERFIENTGYEFPVGLDPDMKIFTKYATNFIPRNFLIDAEGRVLYVSVGYDKTEFAELVRNVEEALQ